MTSPRKPRKRGFGELERRASGSVRARYVGPDLARHQRTFATMLDAEAWLVAERKLIDTDTWTPPRTRTRVRALTVAEYAVGNVATRTLAPRTAEEYDRYLERFVAGTDLGGMPLRSVTPADVALWTVQLRKGTGQVLAARVYGLVSSVFNAAVADGLVEHSPCRVRGATNAPRQSPKTAATPAEVAAVLAHLPPNRRALVLLAAWGGLRSGELRALRRRDVDLEAGTVTVVQQVQQLRGQGQVVRIPKTRAALRTVHLPRFLVGELEAHLEVHVQPGPDGLLFASATGHPVSQSVVHSVWARAREKIGRPDLRLHDLRHTAAMLAASTGATISELQSRLGHATPDAALRYQHAAAGADARIATALDLLGQASSEAARRPESV